jgi:hypothetical protein
LKLKSDEPLSNSAVKSKLRRYTPASTDNQVVVDLIRADMKMPAQKIKVETADMQVRP